MPIWLFPFGIITLGIVFCIIEWLRLPKINPDVTKDFGLRDVQRRDEWHAANGAAAAQRAVPVR